MLNEKPGSAPTDTVLDYLHHALGVQPVRRSWKGAGKLPYFLQDAFELHELTLWDRSLLLAINRQTHTPKIAILRSHLEKLKTLTDRPVIYVTDALASYERKRLIEQKIPFIVPGNQLYLPDLGIDLREYFRQPSRAPAQVLSPATQAVLIKALLERSTETAWQPAAVASGLGYTAMTLSRVVRELTRAGIATLARRGTALWLRMDQPPAATWELARPLLRSPVKRQVWVLASEVSGKKQLPLAGPSALAVYSSLADPALPVYAMNGAQLRALGTKAPAELPEPLPDSCLLQVWTYAPILSPDAKSAKNKKAVDPLSLSLSFPETSDDRIGLALEELKEHFPW